MTGQQPDLLEALRDSLKRAREGRKREPVYGMCTGCGSVEVALHRATGTRDLSYMGESSRYPTGYGCEVCA